MRRLGRTIVAALGLAILPVMPELAQLPPAPMPPSMDRPSGPEMAVSPMPPSQSESPGNMTEGVGGEGGLSVSRDPFWPVGYVPRKPEPVLRPGGPGSPSTRAPEAEPAKTVDWRLARARLDLRGVSSVGRDKSTGKTRFVAVIGGKLAEEGDIVSVVWEGQVYRWRVVTINTSGVSLVKLDVRAE